MTTPGPGDVLTLIRDGRARTRGQVQEITGLSRVTVAQRVDALLEAGLLRGAGQGAATGGRRAVELELDTTGSTIAVIALDSAHAELALTDLAGTVLERSSVPVSASDDPRETLSTLAGALTQLVAQSAHAGLATVADVAGIGISVPGPVDPRTRHLNEPPMLPRWDGFAVEDELRSALGCDVPVLLSRDASAMAYGELTGTFPSAQVLVLVKVSTGIGAGIVIHGTLVEGEQGGAGDIGHIRVPEAAGRLCTCGAEGCLATIASGRAVAAALREAGRHAESGSDVRALLAAGDPEAARLTQQAGRQIGRVLASVVALLNPGVLLLSGDLDSDALVHGVRESLYAAALPRATRDLDVRSARLANDAALVGMAALVVEQEFSADAVNQRLS